MEWRGLGTGKVTAGRGETMLGTTVSLVSFVNSAKCREHVCTRFASPPPPQQYQLVHTKSPLGSFNSTTVANESRPNISHESVKRRGSAEREKCWTPPKCRYLAGVPRKNLFLLSFVLCSQRPFFCLSSCHLIRVYVHTQPA